VIVVEWICWLNGQRKKAPTPEELAELEARRERVRQNIERMYLMFRTCKITYAFISKLHCPLYMPLSTLTCFRRFFILLCKFSVITVVLCIYCWFKSAGKFLHCKNLQSIRGFEKLQWQQRTLSYDIWLWRHFYFI